MNPGDDVWVNFEDHEWPGEIIKIETSGYTLCRIHTDPQWDFGAASARVMPEQTIAARHTNIRKRTQ